MNETVEPINPAAKPAAVDPAKEARALIQKASHIIAAEYSKLVLDDDYGYGGPDATTAIQHLALAHNLLFGLALSRPARSVR